MTKLKAKYGPRRDGSYGKVMEYKIGDDGIVDVAEEHVEFLLNTNNFELAEEEAGNGGNGSNGGDGEMLIQSGDETIDLMKLDRDALMELANGEMKLGVHPRTGVDKLRAAIMEFCSSHGE